MSRNGNDLLCVSFVNYEFVCVFSLLFTRLQPHLLSNLTENVWINDLLCVHRGRHDLLITVFG